jgi:hypothetical protein
MALRRMKGTFTPTYRVKGALHANGHDATVAASVTS